MAIVVLEEVLVGLDDLKASLQQAIMTLEGIIGNLPADFGTYLPTALEREVLRPVQTRVAFVERLQQVLTPLAEEA